MENERRKLKIKEKINMNEKKNRNERKPNGAKGITIKSISIILIVTILAVTILIVLLSTNTTKDTQETQVRAMEQRRDYIKEIERVTQSNEYMTMETDADGVQVPVPKGYVGSTIEGENTVKGGYVIYEGTNPVNGDDIWNERNTRNQYVWVPVDKDQLSQMYGIDSNGKMWGKLYDFDELNSNTTGTAPNNWSESNGVMKISSTSYREPDVVSYYDIPSYLRRYGARAESTEELLMDLEKEFTQSIISIAKYGGFYIGRYETGGLNAEAKVVRMDTNISSQTWYSMYEKCKKLRGANENVVTSMIFGSQFDRTLMWLIESDNDIEIADVATDSKDWGNYYNVSLKYDSDGDGSEEATKQESRSTRIPAGSSEQTKANNIYDLCGNVYDWTIEACGTVNRVLRGGYYGNSSAVGPASYRNDFGPYNSGSFYGCRAALFIR